MKRYRSYAIGLLFLGALIGGVACDNDDWTKPPPIIQYKDQTFTLLVCDGNGNAAGSWGHDGAEVCTLDWNNDGSGPNRLPVVYVYNNYPIVDGAVTRGTETAEGDEQVWEQAPWVTIPVHPVYGGGSGVRRVQAKAVFTYVNTPRIWFLFQWEDPSHTVRGNSSDGPDAAGVMQYHWYSVPGRGYENNRQWDAREDWLALVWSTWFIWNTNDKGIGDKDKHAAADLDGYDWKCVETVPGFQARGLGVIKGSGDIVYRTPYVNSQDPASPYYDKYYPGPFCDWWFFSATRTNYAAEGGWQGEAFLIDGYIDRTGFSRPPVGSNGNAESLRENLLLDGGTIGYEANGGVNGFPAFQGPADPENNPPGPCYLWKDNAVPFDPHFAGACAVIPGYLHRPAVGSVADIKGRATWWDPTEANYEPYDWPPVQGNPPDPENPWNKFPRRPHNLIQKKWNYTLEIEREIGALGENQPTEDALLGIFEPHPGE